METKEIVEQLVKQGCELYKGLTVRNVSVTPGDNSNRIALTLKEEVDGMIEDPNNPGTFIKGKTHVVFVSDFNIMAIMKDKRKTAFAAEGCHTNPNRIKVLFSYAKVNLLKQEVEAGQYTNPFSTNGKASDLKHDTILYHLVDFELDKEAEEDLKELKKDMLF